MDIYGDWFAVGVRRFVFGNYQVVNNHMDKINKNDLATIVEMLGTILYYPRSTKAEILFGSSSDENIALVDELQAKYYPEI